MTMTVSYILIGLVTGLFSGALGLGGGLIVVPALVYLYGFTQHQAQGTSLAMMIPPITVLAVLQYYHSGNVKISVAALLACGFIAGSLFSADIAQRLPDILLKRTFGVIMLLVSLKMIFSR